MSRPKNIIPQFISIDMQKLDEIQNSMEADADLGKWVRQAIRDLRTGCKRNGVDKDVLEAFSIAKNRMVARQDLNAKIYETKKKAKAKKPETKKEPKMTETEQQANPSKTQAELFPPEEKKAYGEFKHVMLTETEGAKLRETYGKNLNLAISILDSWLENNPRKKYKSHYACMKKSGWVWDEVQKKNRLEQNNSQKSFAAQDRERGAMLAESVMSKTGTL